jgi:hypothetical protein
MTAKILILRPHFFNCRLRYINRRIMLALPMYPIPSESEYKPPVGCELAPPEYETLPTAPDS